MTKQVTATIIGFITTFIANTALAMTIIGPFFNAQIGISRDPQKDGLNFPAILTGYLLLTVFLVWLIPFIKGKSWLQRGLIAGTMTGLAVNIGGHLITAGWSIANGMGMLYAGIFDSFATIAGAIVISYFLRNYEK